MTASLGVTCFDAGITNADQLVERVDSCLYRAKATGRNRVEAAHPNAA